MKAAVAAGVGCPTANAGAAMRLRSRIGVGR